LDGRKGIRPVKKTEWWGAGVVICLEQGADLHMAQLMFICHCHSLSLASVKSRLVFAFLEPAHPGSPGQRAVKRVCVCVCKTVKRIKVCKWGSHSLGYKELQDWSICSSLVHAAKKSKKTV